MEREKFSLVVPQKKSLKESGRMKCPICGREIADDAEFVAHLMSHQQDEARRQAEEMQRVYLMLMASQLTVACVTTRSSAQDVVSTFGEVYGLLENLATKSDVTSEIEEWLKKSGQANSEEDNL
jgi:hypothetical protein